LDIKEYERKFKKYKKQLNDNFPETLNRIINDLDPTILANEYNLNYSKRMASDPFYQLKFDDMGRKYALKKFK